MIISYSNGNGKYQSDYSRLYKAHVPNIGVCTTIEGELIRSISALFYEYSNNGNCNARDGEYETCEVCCGDGCYICDYEGEVYMGSTISDVYSGYLSYIDQHVGCVLLTDQVSRLILVSSEYKFDQSEMNIYNILFDTVIEYVLEKGKLLI